jgi:hypothetical protein
VQVKAAGRFRILADVRAAAAAGASLISAALSPELATAAMELFADAGASDSQALERSDARPRAVASRAG